jgi:hypothetical protein
MFWSWLKNWAAVSGFVLLGGAWTMIQIDEYLLAAFCLIVGLFAFIIQIKEWKGVSTHPILTKWLKGWGFLVAICIIGYFMIVVHVRKGDKPWSVILTKREQPERVTPSPEARTTPIVNPHPTPASTSSPMPTPIPSPSPSPSTTAPKPRSKRSREGERQRQREREALEELHEPNL